MHTSEVIARAAHARQTVPTMSQAQPCIDDRATLLEARGGFNWPTRLCRPVTAVVGAYVATNEAFRYARWHGPTPGMQPTAVGGG